MDCQGQDKVLCRTHPITSENFRSKLQILDDGLLNMTTLHWELQVNNGQGKQRETMKATIPWDRFGDFFDGEFTLVHVPYGCIHETKRHSNDIQMTL